MMLNVQKIDFITRQYSIHYNIQRPFNMTRMIPGNIMVFDVETTGLIPNVPLSHQTINSYPYIIQLSYIVYNTRRHTINQSQNMHIRIPSSVVLSEKITQLTGITRERCNTGVPILSALQQFASDYFTCEWVVSHNMKFDSTMIRAETVRHADILVDNSLSHLTKLFDDTIKIPKKFCTMMNGIDICNIKATSKKGTSYKKWPRLVELYNTLFPGEIIPDGLHNAYIDTLVCLRCYLKMNTKEMSKDKFHSLCGIKLSPEDEEKTTC